MICLFKESSTLKITRRYIVSLDLAALQDRSKQRIHEAILGKSQVLGSDLVLEAFEGLEYLIEIV